MALFPRRRKKQSKGERVVKRLITGLVIGGAIGSVIGSKMLEKHEGEMKENDDKDDQE